MSGLSLLVYFAGDNDEKDSQSPLPLSDSPCACASPVDEQGIQDNEEILRENREQLPCGHQISDLKMAEQTAMPTENASSVIDKNTVDDAYYLGEIKLKNKNKGEEICCSDGALATQYSVVLPKNMLKWISAPLRPVPGDLVNMRFLNKKLYRVEIVDSYDLENGDYIVSGKLLNCDGWLSLICSGNEVKMQLFDNLSASLYNMYYEREARTYNVRELHLTTSDESCSVD